MPELRAWGHTFPTGKRHISGIMGTHIHLMLAELLRIKQVAGDITNVDIEAALQTCWPAFDEDASKPDVKPDDITPDKATAQEQMRRILWAFFPALDLMQPKIIERKFEEEFSPLGDYAIPVQLSGTLDVLEHSCTITDHKTGKDVPAPEAQLGGYSLLCKAAGLPVTHGRLNFAQRVALTKLQPAAELIEVDISECEELAWQVLKDIQRHYTDWHETHNPHSFPANPNSQLCTKKYCPVWGTTFCRIGR